MTMKLKGIILSILLSACAISGSAEPEEARIAQFKALTNSLQYQKGEVHLDGGIATIRLPENFRYLDPAGAEKLLIGIWGNPPSEKKSLGLIVPEGFDPMADDAWCVVLDFQEDGYVKDDDAESINYDKLLKEMKGATRDASQERVRNGYPSIELVGWAATPRYDRQTHKFYWAKEIKFAGSEENTLNYNLRVLGRRGILVLNAIANMSQLAQIEKATPEILGMIEFNEGHRYADYTPGSDKVAAYGIAAIVAGSMAAKTGLFKALLMGILAFKKFLILGVVGLLALIQKLFSRKGAQ